MQPLAPGAAPAMLQGWLMLFVQSCVAIPGAGLAISMVCRRTGSHGGSLGFTLSSEPPANLSPPQYCFT